MKTFLFHIEPDEAFAARIAMVSALAEKYGAHVIASHIVPQPDFYVPYSDVYLLSGEANIAFLEGWKEVAQNARQTFEASWPVAGSTWEWKQENGITDILLAEQARTADLTIVGLGKTTTESPRLSSQLAGDITLLNGLPVLALPEGAPAPLGEKPVIIAWDGSIEAVHAIRYSLPFLASAPEIIIVEIGENITADLPSADIAPYLARYGFKIEAIRQAATNSVADELLTVAHTNGAELIVMGAYAHTRLREYILGGVTRRLLQNANVPILLCH